MTEIATTGIFLGIPVVGQFHFATRIAWRAQEDQRVTPFLIVRAADLFQAQSFAIKA